MVTWIIFQKRNLLRLFRTFARRLRKILKENTVVNIHDLIKNYYWFLVYNNANLLSISLFRQSLYSSSSQPPPPLSSSSSSSSSPPPLPHRHHLSINCLCLAFTIVPNLIFYNSSKFNLAVHKLSSLTMISIMYHTYYLVKGV